MRRPVLNRKLEDSLLKAFTALAATLVTYIALPWPANGHDKHNRQIFSAGEPGNLDKPSRTIEVEMSEMEYTPSRIDVKRGEPIRFVIRNVGKEDHEFLLATTEEILNMRRP